MENNSYYELDQDKENKKIISFLGPTIFPSHFHKKPEITYLTEGTCTSIIANNEYFAKTNDIIFVSKYTSHSYTTSDDAKRFIIAPNNETNADYDQISSKKHFACILDDKHFNKQRILPILKSMLDCQQSLTNNPMARWLALKGYTNVMYAFLLERYGDSMILRNSPTETFEKILAYIEENYSGSITLGNLADVFGYNKFYLSRLFNNYIGTNLNDYVNSVRVNKIIGNYDANNKKTMFDLALSAGFESMSSFYRAFKKTFNQNPKDYFANLKREP